MPTCQEEPALDYQPTNRPNLRIWVTKKSWKPDRNKTPAPNPQPFQSPFPLLFVLPFSPRRKEESFEERDFRHRSQSNTGLVFMWQNYSPSFPAASKAILCAASPEWNPSLLPGRVEHSLQAAAPLGFSLNYCSQLQVLRFGVFFLVGFLLGCFFFKKEKENAALGSCWRGGGTGRRRGEAAITALETFNVTSSPRVNRAARCPSSPHAPAPP